MMSRGEANRFRAELCLPPLQPGDLTISDLSERRHRHFGDPRLVLVCGSRTWWDKDTIYRKLAELPKGTTIMHGGAPGADRLAGIVAAGLPLALEVVKPEWDRHGKRAGLIRNIEMLERKPDLVLAFWDGQSKGTAHTISEAVRRKIPVEITSPSDG